MFRLLCAWGLVLTTLAYSAASYRYVRVPVSLLTPSWVTASGFIRDHVHHDRFAIGYLPSTWRGEVEAVPLDEELWRTQQMDPVTLLSVPQKGVWEPYEDFHTYATLTEELQRLATKFPSLVQLRSAGRSVEGRELWYLVLSSSKGSVVAKPKLLYISSMHGDEVTGKELMVYLIRYLLQGYGTDPRATRLLDHAELFLMPSMNPDGTERRQRWNADGEDLNRNFPLMEEDPFSTAGRAPETLALMELHRQHHFHLAMNYHGGALCVNIPWDHKPNPAGSSQLFGDDAVMRHLAQAYASQNGPMSQQTHESFVNGVTYGYEWFQVLGGMQDWASHFRQSIHATLEVSSIKWPSASALPGYWRDNQEAMLRYLEGGLTGIHVQVEDPSGNPLPVSVAVDSSTRALQFEGYAHRVTVPGTTRVTLTSPGYRDVTLDLNAGPFDGAYTRVVMEP